jgi:NAD dependent epimerase/dehydratase family enzyme
MREFSNVLGKVLNKPAWLTIPGFVLRLALGEMADKLVLSGQRALPKRLLEAGFQFKYINVESALSAILG